MRDFYPAFVFLLLFCGNFASAVVSKSKVKLENNRYTGLVIAINPNVTEDPKLIDAIKQVWTDASPILFRATQDRAYFGEVTILLPSTWTSYSSYATASGETYDKADILVADPNPSHGDAPYTLQYGGCNSSGSYVHLTPNYLLDSSISDNFGNRGKVIVHEWAHYRWGVFDETSTTDPFYDDGNGNTLYDSIEGDTLLSFTQCGKDIQVCCLESGMQTYCDPNLWKPGQSHCAIDVNTGVYSDSCTCYVKQPVDEYDASVMSYQYIDSIFAFCEDTSDPTSRKKHNKNAPNDQNRLCNMKSTWSVISESADFMSGKNLPISKSGGFDPVFSVKIASDSQRFVLVLDTSGSMSSSGPSGETRIEQACQAANYFIMNSAPTGSHVGIVQFASSASVISPLKELTNSSARQNLTSLLPKVATGGTCIGCGIETGIDVLEELSPHIAAGGYLLVMTDGEETTSPFVNDVYDTVIMKKVVVQTLMVYTDANQILTNLSVESGGDWFFAGSDDLLALIDAYNEMASVVDGDVTKKTFEILSESVKLDTSANYHETSASIDFTIGNNTVFTYTWSYGTTAPWVSITPPNGSCVISNYLANTCTSPLEENAEYKTLTAVIPGRAEVGVWKSLVSLSTTFAQSIVIIVTSMVADVNTPPIIVESALEVRDDGTPLVYAKVTQGLNPVLGAKVTATLSKEGASNTNPTQLYDAGADPDIRRNDGIYSRYVTGIGGGRYSVKVHVESAFGGYDGVIVNSRYSEAAYNPGYVSANGTVVANPNGHSFLPKNTPFGVTSEQLGNFSRQASAGAFEYTPLMSPGGTPLDAFPPSKVIDLKVNQNDFNNFTKGIVLSFTAPGDDYDSGIASNYEIRFTVGSIENLLNDFTNNELVTEGSVIEGDIQNPQTAGTLERIVVETPTIVVGNATSISIGFAVRAHDDDSNSAEVSNVATLRYYIQPPVFAASGFTTVQVLTTEEETTTFESTTLLEETTTAQEPMTEGETTTPSLTTMEDATAAQWPTTEGKTIPSESTTMEATTTEHNPATTEGENRISANTAPGNTAEPPTSLSSAQPIQATTKQKCANEDCTEVDDQDLTWLYITIPILVVVGAGGVAVGIWFYKSGRWSKLSNKSSRSVSPTSVALDQIENGEETPDERQSISSKSAWE